MIERKISSFPCELAMLGVFKKSENISNKTHRSLLSRFFLCVVYLPQCYKILFTSSRWLNTDLNWIVSQPQTAQARLAFLVP